MKKMGTYLMKRLTVIHNFASEGGSNHGPLAFLNKIIIIAYLI